MATVGDLKTKISLDSAQFEQSMAGVNRQLQGLRHEQKAVTSSGTGFARGVDELRGKSDVLTRTLTVQQAKVEELRKRYEESRKATGDNSKETQQANRDYQKAKAEMNKTENALKGITQELERQTNPWKKLSENMDETGRKMQDIGKNMSSFGRSWSMRVTAPIVGLGAAALKVGMDFEEGMSQVQAISGATGEDFEALKSQAREMGATTRFSATEAASGMEFLAMAGFETNEIMEAMPGLLDLAASSNMDLGRAADIASNIISGFGMEAEEAGRVSDVLAKGASTANTNVEQLGNAMEVVAPVAEMVDLEIEGLTAGIGRMSDAGIQGQKAGRMLRQGILRLSDPTGEAADLIEDLGINAFDADGNMKDLDQVVGQLNKGLEGMDSQAQAAALSTIFGSESTAGWSALLKVGEDDLKSYTKELKDSEGAASDMADTMEDNAKGALRELRSAAEEAGIAFSEHVIPMFTEGVEKGTEMIRKFGELDDSTQKNIIKMGLFAAAIGPAAIVLGNLTTGIGGLLRVGGSLTKLLGMAGGSGLVGRLGLLGTAGPVGLAIAGVGGLSAILYTVHKRSKENKEVNTELAESYQNQATELQTLVDEYEELSNKSKLTTDEFARMMDIQSELEKTQNPAKIAELNEEYDKLAEKSGLSKDEIKNLIDANNGIIDQSPEVEKSYTDQVNAVVESTDAVQGYINKLNEMAMVELEAERTKALEREKEIMEEQTELKNELKNIEQEMSFLNEAYVMSDEERLARLEEIGEELENHNLTHGEKSTLLEEEAALNQANLGKAHETLDALGEQRDKIMEKMELNDEELAKLELIEAQMADLLLSEVDLNWEKGEGLDKLDENLSKLEKEREKIVENTSSEEKKTKEYRDQLAELDEAINKHQNVRDKIMEELGLQSEKNAKLDQQNDKASLFRSNARDTIKNIMGQGNAQDGTNKKIDTGYGWATRLTKELGKDTSKNVDLKETPTIQSFNDRLRESVSKKVRLSVLGNSITDGFNLTRPGYAKGTDNHPGGSFIAGEEGYELGRLGNRWEMLNFGMYDRPRGYEVFTHNESKRILGALNNMPAYAGGARDSGASDRVVGQLNQQVPTSNTVNLSRMFEGASFIVREDADIPKIAKQLNDYIKKGARSKGVIM